MQYPFNSIFFPVKRGNMKTFTVAFVFFLAAITSARATNYYVSSYTGNDSRTAQQAQNPSTPWQSLNKLNAIFPSLKPGDTVFLQRGSFFVGSLRITQSGIAGKPIVIAAYGSGFAPIISGFTQLKSWTSIGGNIWQSYCGSCGVSENMVKVGNSIQPMGRWPNSNTANGGYAVIQSHADSTTITDPALGSTANWTGADLVIRKYTWVIERDPILQHSGTTIRYKTATNIAAADKFGYFVQNSLKTLDQNGEWYYDAQNKKMNIYWTSDPSSASINVATTDTLISIYKKAYVSIQGLFLQGANRAGIYAIQSNNISFADCSVIFTGIDGIKTIQCTSFSFQRVTVDQTGNNGMDLNGSGNLVQDCRISRTGTIPGMGNAIQSYMGLTLRGDNNTVQYTKIDTTGYSPLEFVGANNTIKNNVVDYFAFVKDDGGGIYTWSGDISPTTKRPVGTITGNVVSNGIACPAGTDGAHAGIAHGIYLDYNSGYANITGNTVSNCTAGIFIQDGHYNTVQQNTFFNNNAQIILRHAVNPCVFANNDISNNIAVSANDAQSVVQATSIDAVNGTVPLTSFGYLHDNKYARISASSPFFTLGMKGLNTTGSLGLWKSSYAMDYTSIEKGLSFAPYTINKLIGSNLYTKGSIITPFAVAAANTRVIASSGVGAITAGKTYVTHFTLHAPDDSRTMLVFMQKATSPWPCITNVASVGTASPSTNNTVVFENTTAGDASCALVFQMNLIDPRIYVDNIDLYEAEVTKNDPTKNYFFRANPTKSAITVALPSGISYQNINGTAYQGSFTLQPFSSVVLFKK
jgi:parallel beta-helix repeat protein